MIPDARVVGFSGTVLVGAAAVKDPVLREGDRWFSGDLRLSSNTTTYGPTEIDDFKERGLLTLLERPYVPLERGVILYAHETFVRHGERDLVTRRAEARFDEQHRFYYDYMHADSAGKMFATWSTELRHTAAEALKNGDFDLAKAAAARACFVIDPKNDPDARLEAHCHMATAKRGLKERLGGLEKIISIESGAHDSELHRAAERALDARPTWLDDVSGSQGEWGASVFREPRVGDIIAVHARRASFFAVVEEVIGQFGSTWLVRDRIPEPKLGRTCVYDTCVVGTVTSECQ